MYNSYLKANGLINNITYMREQMVQDIIRCVGKKQSKFTLLWIC